MTAGTSVGLCRCGDEATHFITYDDALQGKVVQLTYFCEDHAREMLKGVGFALHGLLPIPENIRREWSRYRKTGKT